MLCVCQGGSLFSPAVVMSASKAQAQTASLAKELGCTASDITQLLTCLRNKPAQSINAAQTKVCVTDNRNAVCII